jgi:hypothetical protein
MILSMQKDVHQANGGSFKNNNNNRSSQVSFNDKNKNK